MVKSFSWVMIACNTVHFGSAKAPFCSFRAEDEMM